MAIPVIAIFDIGKTNKKVFLFDEKYDVRLETSVQLAEIKDEDGFPCEDVEALTAWVISMLQDLIKLKDFEIKAINFSAHGASFVNVDQKGKPVTPLYNYLKPYPKHLQDSFYDTYGGDSFSVTAASPILGHLNSGMQLYWLKKQKPEVYEKIKYSLHLPEYISWLVTKIFVSGITSIGCHTNLWNFATNSYHGWVSQEKIIEKLAPIYPSDQVVTAMFHGHQFLSGIGLHDSSSALIPYLKYCTEPFVLISTGTWSISLNPFNQSPLTIEELKQDCLCYLSFEGKPIKASRLFAGQEHDDQVKVITNYFSKSDDYYKTLEYDSAIVKKINQNQIHSTTPKLSSCTSFEEAYHLIIINLVKKQKISTELILQNTLVKNIFVDGGFGQNKIYMNLIAAAFPNQKVFAATVHQASAIGAALVIHSEWNSIPVPTEIIHKIYYPT